MAGIEGIGLMDEPTGIEAMECIMIDMPTRCQTIAANISVHPAAWARWPGLAWIACHANHTTPIAINAMKTHSGTTFTSGRQIERGTITSMTSAISRCRPWETRPAPLAVASARDSHSVEKRKRTSSETNFTGIAVRVNIGSLPDGDTGHPVVVGRVGKVPRTFADVRSDPGFGVAGGCLRMFRRPHTRLHR